MLLSWLSEEAVRYEVFSLRVELKRRNLLQGILLLVVLTGALIDHRKLTSTDFLSDVVAILN